MRTLEIRKPKEESYIAWHLENFRLERLSSARKGFGIQWMPFHFIQRNTATHAFVLSVTNRFFFNRSSQLPTCAWMPAL